MFGYASLKIYREYHDSDDSDCVPVRKAHLLVYGWILISYCWFGDMVHTNKYESPPKGKTIQSQRPDVSLLEYLNV